VELLTLHCVRHLGQIQTESVVHLPSSEVILINPPVGTDSHPPDLDNAYDILLHIANAIDRLPLDNWVDAGPPQSRQHLAVPFHKFTDTVIDGQSGYTDGLQLITHTGLTQSPVLTFAILQACLLLVAWSCARRPDTSGCLCPTALWRRACLVHTQLTYM